MMRYGSVCSGIEAASVAWHGLGWQPAWFSEIEAFPSAVLAHRWPGVTNRGDMTKLPAAILAGEIEAPDLLVGGTPCQAFSVAGQRRSLDDARGNLTLTFVELADAIGTVRRAAGRPGPIILWENVPGVLNTKDNAFGCFLGGLAGADEELRPVGRKWPRAGVVHGPRRRVAWCVLDAQYFGVAQRRRRVFVVAVPNELVEHLGDRAHPAEILSIGKSLRRDTPTRGQAGQGAAAGTAPSLTASGRGVERTGESRGQDPVVAVPLGLGEGGELARALNACHTASGRHDVSVDTFVAHTLRANHDASEDGTGRGTPLVPVAQPIPINTMVGLRHKALGEGTGLGIGKLGDPANTLSKAHSHAVAQPIAFKIRGGSETDTGSQGSLTPGRAAGKGFLGSEERAFTVGATQDQFLAAPNRIDGKKTLQYQGITFYCEDDDASPQEANAISHLRLLQEALGEEAFAQWRLGVLDSLQAQEVLRPDLHGGGIRCEADEARRGMDSGALPRQEDGAQGPMLEMREAGRSRRSPQGRGLQEQHARELNSALQELSPEGTQPSWLLLGLWNEGERAGLLQQALPAIQGGQAVMLVRRLTPVECERLQGFPDQYTNIPYRGKSAADGPRYKALGNSMAVPCMAWLGHRIADAFSSPEA